MSDHRHIFASPGSSNEEASRTSHYPTLPSPSSSVSAPPEPPLLLIKITAFRLLITAVLLAFGIPKPVPSYRGESAVPTTLDWILGILCAAALYWLGLFEGVDPPVLKWLLHDDYAVALILTMIFSLTALATAIVSTFICIALFHIGLVLTLLVVAMPTVFLAYMVDFVEPDPETFLLTRRVGRGQYLGCFQGGELLMGSVLAGWVGLMLGVALFYAYITNLLRATVS